jgi:hypothetical protein
MAALSNPVATNNAAIILAESIAGTGIAIQSPVARPFAEAFASRLRDSLAKGKIPTATSAAVDTVSGRVFYGVSGEVPRNVHPDLAARMPAESLERWCVTNCAEFNAVNRALHAGAEMESLEVHTVVTRTGRPMPRCDNCRVTTSGVNVTSD